MTDDDEIAQKGRELHAVLERMDVIKESFIASAGNRCKEWIMEDARERYIRGGASKAPMTDDELRQLQNEARERAEGAPNPVRELLSSPSFWWHLTKPLPATDYIPYWHYGEHGSPAPARDRISEALNGAAASTRPRTASGGGAQRKVAVQVSWSSEMHSLIREYWTFQASAVKCHQALRQAEDDYRRLRQDAAAKRWDDLLDTK